MQQLDQIIGDHPFMKDLKPGYLQTIAGCGRNVIFNAGDCIFREGEPSDHFYLLRHGRVALEISAPGQNAIRVQTLGPGEIVGASWLIPPYRWAWDARALETTRLVELNAVCLREKCDADHDFGYELMKRLAPAIGKRLQAARLQLLDIYGTAN